MDLSLSENDRNNPVFFIRRRRVAVEDATVFDLAWASFEWLVTGPNPVAVDGRVIPGLPGRVLPLDELGTALLARGCSQGTRDAAWRYLITRSRAEGGTWTVACTGLALPVLLPVARTLTRDVTADRDEVCAAILTGFLDGLRELDLGRRAILVRLRWRAYRAGALAVREARESPPPREDMDFRSAPPPRPGGHPDLLLAAAVQAGAITAGEAGLISATRIGDVSLVEAAQARGQSYEATKRARLRAEARLLAHLTDDGDHTPTSTPADAPNTAPDDTAAGHATRRARRSATPTARLGPTRRVRLRNVTRPGSAAAKNVRPPESPQGPESGVRGRGTRRPADRAHRTPRTGTRPDVPAPREVR